MGKKYTDLDPDEITTLDNLIINFDTYSLAKSFLKLMLSENCDYLRRERAKSGTHISWFHDYLNVYINEEDNIPNPKQVYNAINFIRTKMITHTV